MVTLIADIKNGQPVFHDKQKYNNFVKGLEGKRVEIVIKKFVKSRTPNQNKYYWGVCVDMISEETGYSPEEVHELLKQKFLLKPDPLSNALDFRRTGSTANLSTVDFERYLNKIKQFAAEFFSIYIPDPNEAGL